MMDTIAKRLLASASWGLKMRLYVGAGLSTMDLLSDLFMIYTYASTPGQQGTALSLAIMVGLCITGQLLFVYGNHGKAGDKRVLLKEMLIVLTGLAPGIHAMRVAGGGGEDEGAGVRSDLALTVTRMFELACESVPGSIVQVVAALKEVKRGDGVSRAALGSILVSALTTGFSGASIR
jgi:hypothetical protein